MATSVPTGDPGSMTVSFLFGWQHILVGLVVVIALAVLFFVVLAAGRGQRSDWQADLAARSRRLPDLSADQDEETASPVR